jgi:D-arabinose 1-dehydrogenase-like Zn-dependent alcohol dehydrogenase
MRKQNVEAGGLVAIQGLGGLGHLALQYASKMGYRTVALSSSASKKAFATKLGAHDYIDGSKADTVKKLNEMGGADMILCTAPNPKIIAPLVGALGPRGKLLLVASEYSLSLFEAKLTQISRWRDSTEHYQFD